MLTAKYMRDRPIDWNKLVGEFVPPSSSTEGEEEEEEDDDDDDEEQGATRHGEDAVPSATAPAFSLARFLHEFARVAWHDCRYVKITRIVAAERVVRALTCEPETIFARIVRSSVTVPLIADDGETQRRFAEDVRRAASQFDVFPNALLSTRADSFSWVLVKHAHRSQVTVSQAREMMRRARQTGTANAKRKAGTRGGRARQECKRRRRRILSTSEDSASCITGAEEEEEEEQQQQQQQSQQQSEQSAAVGGSSSSSRETVAAAVPELEPVAGPSTVKTDDGDDDDDDDDEPPKKRKSKPRIIRDIRFGVRHDEALLRHAILTSNVTTFKMWSSFKKANMRLFGRCRVRDIIARLQQLARGLGAKRFKENNAQALKALRDLYR